MTNYMFFSKRRRHADCWKNGKICEIKIEGPDEECKEEVQIIIDFIKEISAGKSVFISAHGDKDIINEDAILSYEKSPKRPYIHNMQISPENVSAWDKLFMNLYTDIYIFEKAVEWNDFININGMKEINTYFKSGSLSAFIQFTNSDGTHLRIKENHAACIKKLLERLQDSGFSIKMK